MKPHWKAVLSITLLFIASESLARKKTRHTSRLTKKTDGSAVLIKLEPADTGKPESAVTNKTGSAVPNKIESILRNPIGSLLTNGGGTIGTNETGPAVPNKIGSIMNKIGSIITNGIGPMGPNMTGPIGTGQTGPIGTSQTGPIETGQSGPIGTGQSGPIETSQSGPIGTGQTGPIETGQSGPIETGQSGPIGTNATGSIGKNVTGSIGTGQTGPIGTNATGSRGTSSPGPTNQTGSEETKAPGSAVTSKPPTGSVSANKIKAGRPTWGYGVSGRGFYGPADWDIVSAQCKGSNQSPIDIFPHATPFKVACKTMLLESDNKLGLVTGVLSNTGHAVQFKVNEKDGTAFLSGGPADSARYRLSSIQFHVGCMDGSGSEHTINSKPASAEMQMVFYNEKYKNINQALSQPDGITIISSLFDYYGGETYYHNPTLEQLVSFLSNITQPGSSVNLDYDDRIELTKLVPELTRDCPPYYTYKGSLTTPPCYESVTWILLKTRLTISIQQLGQFRQLQSRNGSQLCDNFRLVQPTNNREVTKNYLQEY